MMTYVAPDGHIIESSSSGPVVYSCPVSGMVEGVFDSLETEGADTPIGIQQIKINRVITSTLITITITESTDAELLAYKEEVDNSQL